MLVFIKLAAGSVISPLLINATNYMPAGSYILLRYGLLIEFIQKFLKSASHAGFRENYFEEVFYLTGSSNEKLEPDRLKPIFVR